MNRRRWTFPRPPSYRLRDPLRCFSMAGSDPSQLRLPGGGRRKLFWLGDQLARLTAGCDDATIAVELETRDGEAPDLSKQHIRNLLGLDDEIGLELDEDSPLLAVPKLQRQMRLGRSFWFSEAVVQTILHQRVSGSEAGRSWTLLCRRFGREWDGLFSMPDARTLLNLSPAELASCGIESKRQRPIKEVAFRLPCNAGPEADLDELSARMLACQGVGVWTESYVRGHFLGDPDAVPLGDYDLPKIVTYFFEKRRDGTDEDMLHLLEPYKGQRFRVLSWIGFSGIRPPRRGARLPHGTLFS